MGWQISPAPKINNERAERLFWRAVYLWESREASDTRASYETLLEALALEPGFSRAHAQLAIIFAHKTGPHLGLEAPTLFDQAETQIAAAEENGTRLPEINISKALIYFYRDKDFEEALRYLDDGLESWPNNALLWQTRAMVTSAMGRHDESLFSIAKARALDPLSHSINWDRVWFLYLAGRFEEALQAAQETEQISSDIHHYYIALIYEALGNRQMAFNHWLRMVREVGFELPFQEVGPNKQVDYQERYKTLLDFVEADGRTFYPDAVKVFWAYLSGDRERTFALLETMPIEQNNWVFYWLSEIPLFSAIKEEERFVAIVRVQNNLKTSQ
jgi:tetratricopeptide (TPR) repeat protein